ncbi:MAG: hypothetical protein KF777_13630 [Planctomycetaceae bacterium]|nr:hypothetical protein [Planctomycetaceae bacterium]
MTPDEATAIRERIQEYDQADQQIRFLEKQIAMLDRLTDYALKVEHVGISCCGIHLDDELQPLLRGWLKEQLQRKAAVLSQFQDSLDCPSGHAANGE